MTESVREKRLEKLLKEFIDDWERDIAGCRDPDCRVCKRRYKYVNRVRKELGMEQVSRQTW